MAEDRKEIAEAIKATMGTMTLEYELDRYERRAYQILAEEGYPADYAELAEQIYHDESVPQRARDAQRVLTRVMSVRHNVEKGDAESSAWSAIILARVAMRADLPEYDKALVSEYQSSNAKKKEVKDR